eukprot:scaffold105177_cov35-Tisochrysis_lutea.AAC.5
MVMWTIDGNNRGANGGRSTEQEQEVGTGLGGGARAASQYTKMGGWGEYMYIIEHEDVARAMAASMLETIMGIYLAA